MHKVLSVFVGVVLLLLSPEKDSKFVNGQDLLNINQDDINKDKNTDLKPQARQLIAIPEQMNEDEQMVTEELQQEDFTGQEPMRRRRRPGGRKRRRRPHHGHHQMDAQESNPYWNRANTDPYYDAAGAGDVTGETQQYPDKSGGRRGPNRNWNRNRNEFMQEPVLRVHDESGIKRRPADLENRVRYPENEARERPFHRERSTEIVPSDQKRTSPRDNSYRKPYSQAKKERENQQLSDGSQTTDLKELLKQSGGLSLSEILQQKNLSLDDLLKGKQNALRALQSKPDPVHATTEPSKIRRIPASVNSSVRPIGMAASIQIEENPPDNRSNRRIPLFSRPKSPEPTIQTVAATLMTVEEKTSVPQDYLTPPKMQPTEIPGSIEIITIATIDQSGIRHLPPSVDRARPIKEVISGIRPDLTNSNTRKRLLPLKLKTTNTVDGGSTTQKPILVSEKKNILDSLRPKSTIPPSTTVKERVPLRYHSPYRLNTRESDVNPTISTESESTTSSTTTTTTTSTESSVPVIKDIIKARLALRPRLRIPHLAPNPKESTFTTTTSATVPTTTSTTTTTTTTEVPTTQNDLIETTMIPQTRFSDSNSSLEEIKEIIENSQPESNSIVDDSMLLDLRNPFQDPNSIVKQEEDIIDGVGEIFLLDNEQEEDDTTSQGAFTLKIDDILERYRQRSEDITKKSDQFYLTENTIITRFDVTERNPSLFIDITSERSVDDRTELLDLLEDRRSGARLSKVLAQRNMTLEELIEHRQRGSSQLHLAEIFNKSKPNISTTRTFIPAAGVSSAAAGSMDIVTAFDNFPSFNLDNLKSVKPDDIKTDSQGSSYFTSIVNIKPTDEIYKEGRSLFNAGYNKPHMEVDKFKSNTSPNQYEDTMENNFIDVPQNTIVSSSRLSPQPTHENDIYTDVIQIENEISRAHDLINLEEHGAKRNIVHVESAQMPVAMRSVIIASASIIGISLFIFLIIFVTCRWRQNKKKKVSYNENFQAVRSRLPILARQSSVNLSSRRHGGGGMGGCGRAPIVFPAGPRNSKLNTMDPNSPEVQEYLYDAMRKPF